LVDEGYARAKHILETERDGLIKLAEALLERETLDAVEIRTVLEGKDLPPRPPMAPETSPQVQVLKPERRPLPASAGAQARAASAARRRAEPGISNKLKKKAARGAAFFIMWPFP
jgi:hypothetical protein